MRLYDYNWMQLQAYLERDDRVVIPLGSVEQHAYLSLGTDAIVAERGAVEAAEGTGVPVLPVLPYGLTPRFTAYPGTITLRLSVYLEVIRDLLDALFAHGFRRFLLVSGHVGNSPAQDLAREWQASHPDSRVRYHALLAEPGVWAEATRIEAEAGHASWVENLPWTRLPDADPPAARKPMVDPAELRVADPVEMRRLLGDGSFGGPYAVADDEVLELWRTAVADVRAAIEDGWGTASDPGGDR